MAFIQYFDPKTKQMRKNSLVLDSYVLGRHSMCEIILAGSAISREHARITHDLVAGFLVEDLNSRNGTRLNDRPLPPHVPTPLHDGDIIKISDFSLEFCAYDSPTGRQESQAKQHRAEDSNSNESAQPASIDNFFDDSQVNITQAILVRPEDDQLPTSTKLVPEDNSVQTENLLLQIKNLKTRLRIMMDLGKNIGASDDLKDMLPTFLKSILTLYPNAGAVCMVSRNEASGQLMVIGHMRRNEHDRSPYRISRSIIDRAIQSRSGIRSDDMNEDSQKMAMGENRSSFMAVPVIEQKQDELLCVIQIETMPNATPFNGDDLELLISVSNQLALQYENSHLQDLRTKEKIMSNELRIAHKVQQGFLPDESPKVEDYEFFDHYRPAKEIGGDYYDYVMLPDNRIAIVVADVAGKGTSAALLVAKLSSDVRYSLLLEKSLPDAMARLNNCYTKNTWDNWFITFLLVVIDTVTDEIHIINAGHVLPILSRTDGSIEQLAEDLTTFPLGVMPDNTYQEYVFTMKSGECLSMMSDGITDAMNQQGDYYTSERVCKYLRNTEKFHPIQLGERLIQTVQDFVGTTPQSDDQCLVVVGKTSPDRIEFID